jgi:hypothetical protein
MLMRKSITTISAAAAVTGAVFATDAATSDTPSEAAISFDVGNRFAPPSGGFYWGLDS